MSKSGVMLPFLILVIAVPLLITPGLLFHYDSAPAVIVLMLVIAAMLFRPAKVERAVRAMWADPGGWWLALLALAAVAWCLITTTVSTRPWLSLFGSNWRRMGLLTVLALMIFTVVAGAQIAQDQTAVRRLLRLMSIVTLAGALYGIAQYFDIDPLQTAVGYHAKDGDAVIVRPPGTLGHADYFGWWLAISLFTSLASAAEETGIWRVAGIGSAFAAGAAIILSGTRGALVATASGLVCVWILRRFKVRGMHLAWAGVIAAVLILFYFTPGGEHLRARVQWSRDEPLGGARPLLWRDSLRMVASRPFTGFGIETFGTQFPHYESPTVARILPDFYHESPHSTALDVLTAEGIPGLLILLGWAALTVHVARRASARGNLTDALLTSALVASTAASLFSSLTMPPAFASLLVIAMLTARCATGKKTVNYSASRAFSFAAPLIGLTLAGFGGMLLVDELQLARFARLVDSRNAAGAIAVYQSLDNLRLPGAAEDEYASRRIMDLCRNIPISASRIECLHAAIHAAARATTTSDNPQNAWYNLAMFTATLNDVNGTEKVLRKAVLASPQWFKPHWALAKVLVLEGRKAEAAEEAERAVLLDAGKHPEVSASLEAIAEAR